MGIIIKPLVTEKMTAITEKMENRFGFVVRPDANKVEIKNKALPINNIFFLLYLSAKIPDGISKITFIKYEIVLF